MENGITAMAAALNIIDELVNDIEDCRASQLAYRMPDLNPCAEPSQNVKFVLPEVEMPRIPDDLHDPSHQPVIVDFKAVMRNQQRTIGIEHAKKVREGKGITDMDAVLRKEYSEDDNYYFPNRIFNSGLSKKDFTVPLLIGLKRVNQDLGMTAELRENERSPPPVQRSVHGSDGFHVNLRDGKRQHDQISGLESGVKNSLTLYPMLEKQEARPKRVKIIEPIKCASPLTRKAAAARKEQAEGRAEGTILALAPTVVSGSTALSGARREQLRSSSPSVLIRNGVQQVIPKPIPQVKEKSPAPLKPRPEHPQLKPILHSAPLGELRNAADNKSARNPQVTITAVPAAEPPPQDDDDFYPKIVDTRGNVQLTSFTPEKHLSNGATSTHPKLKNIVETSCSSSSAVITTTGVGGSGFLGCKICGKTFPSNCDNLFRSHMIIKHEKNITRKCILEAKIQVSHCFKCKKCSLMLLNKLEEHNGRCCPDTDFDSAFDAIQVVTDNVPKLVCGLCQDTLESKIDLRLHLDDKHPEIADKTIGVLDHADKTLLDPHFRCGKCLLICSDSAKLISHVSECDNTAPSLDTVLELAQKYLYCEICAKKHANVRQTLFCYRVNFIRRCVLCLDVFIGFKDFYNHLTVYHDQFGWIDCPFCNDDEVAGTTKASDHIIDIHYNIALKRAGEQALVRGRVQPEAQSTAQKLAAGSKNGLAVGPRTISPKVMPALKGWNVAKGPHCFGDPSYSSDSDICDVSVHSVASNGSDRSFEAIHHYPLEEFVEPHDDLEMPRNSFSGARSVSTDEGLPAALLVSSVPKVLPKSWMESSTFQCLRPKQWIMEDIFNDMTRFLIRSLHLEESVAFVNTHEFSLLLTKRNYSDFVSLAVRSQGLNSDIVVINICASSHFFFAVVAYRRKEAIIIDSMANKLPGTSDVIHPLLLFVAATHYVGLVEFNVDAWKIITETKVQQQPNGFDCGPYAIYNQYRLLQKMCLHVGNDFPSSSTLRRWILYCLHMHEAKASVLLPRGRKTKRLLPKIKRTCEGLLGNLWMSDENIKPHRGSRSAAIADELRIATKDWYPCSAEQCVATPDSTDFLLCTFCRGWFHIESCVSREDAAADYFLCSLCTQIRISI